MLKTFKVPIKIPDDRRQDLFKTYEIISSVFNEHVDWAYQNKSYRKTSAHKELYHYLRNKYPELPSQYIQATRDQALEAVKRSQFKTRKPRKKLFSSIRLDRCTATLKKSGTFTFSSVGKRIKIEIPKPDYFKDIIETWFFQAATIYYDSKRKQFILSLNFKTDDPEKIENSVPEKVVGIDLGIYNTATLSNGTIYNSKEQRRIKREYQYLRNKLQTKGTSSAKKLLKKTSGKEARFSRNVNHILSKNLVNSNFEIFVFEDLRTIRNCHKKYHKKANRMLSNWSFGQLIQFTTYKSEALGKQIQIIDPRYTSQRCSVCNHIDRANRTKSKFICTKCGYQQHADINAAINIRNIFLSTQLLESDKQVAVNHPYELNLL